MERLNKGTKEHLIVDLKDHTDSIVNLTGLNTRYDVVKKKDGTPMVTGASAGNTGMRAYCLIDTTGASWTKEIYELYIIIDNLPEVPRIGPVEFSVN